MTWLDTPPLTTLAVVTSNRHHLRLEGPTPSSRVASGLTGAFGATFAAMGGRFLRGPFPFPFSAIPVVFVAVGAGLAATAAARALLRCSIDVKKSGLTFTWTVPPLPARTLEIAGADLEDLEIVSKEVGSRDELSSIVYQLTLVKRDGTAFAFESFGTRAQANLRKKAIEAIVSRR